MPNTLAISEKILHTKPMIPSTRPMTEYLSKTPRLCLDTSDEPTETSARMRLNTYIGHSRIESTPAAKDITDQIRLRDLIAKGSS